MFKIFSLFLVFIIAGTAFSQTKKWGQAEVNYTIPSRHIERHYTWGGDNAEEVISKGFINLYWFFISDVDGDVCPYYPSCSMFFIGSVKTTNIFQGTLMFSDRLTRDINFVNRKDKYPLTLNGKYYDPVDLYTLQTNYPVHLHKNEITGKVPAE